ncbi:MAG: hypothetical protein ACP5I8_09260 [Phycisphaerae bacterium]
MIRQPLTLADSSLTGLAAEAMDTASGSRAGIAGFNPGQYAGEWQQAGWRQQKTPGAYEGRHFSALDSAGNGAAVTLYDGFCFHPRYVREFNRYCRRSTRVKISSVREQVLPSFYPAAAISVFQGGRCILRSVNIFPPGAFHGEPGTPECTVGPNRVTLRQDGTLGLTLRGYPMEKTLIGPRYRTNQSIHVDLTFKPLCFGNQQILPLRPDSSDGAQHCWAVVVPTASVTGRIQQINLDDDTTLLNVPLDGLGFHDMYFGGSGIGREIHAVTRGHAVSSDWAIMWNHTHTSHPCDTDSIVIFDQSSRPVIVQHPQSEIVYARAGKRRRAYPARMILHGSDSRGNNVELLIQHQNIIESGTYVIRNSCSVQLRSRGAKRYLGAGIMETLSVHGLTWPIISDLANRAVLPVAADDPLWRQ